MAKSKRPFRKRTRIEVIFWRIVRGMLRRRQSRPSATHLLHRLAAFEKKSKLNEMIAGVIVGIASAYDRKLVQLYRHAGEIITGAEYDPKDVKDLNQGDQ